MALLEVGQGLTAVLASSLLTAEHYLLRERPLRLGAASLSLTVDHHLS